MRLIKRAEDISLSLDFALQFKHYLSLVERRIRVLQS